jgi:hypothetical protein
VAVCDELFIGARAIWEIAKIREVFLAAVRHGVLGLSSLGGALAGAPDLDGGGMWVRTGAGPCRVLASILPGVEHCVPINKKKKMRVEDVFLVSQRTGMLALDGEREIALTPESRFAVRLSSAGPWVADIERILAFAARHGYFIDGGRLPYGGDPGDLE